MTLYKSLLIATCITLAVCIQGLLLPNTAVASNAINETWNWSGTPAFIAPDAPILDYPSNGSTGVEIDPLLEWDISNFPLLYKVQVASDMNFVNIVFEDTGLVNSYTYSTPLDYGMQYFWRVAAKDSVGAVTWSNTSVFTTIIASPALLFPLQFDDVGTDPLTFYWEAVSGADSYQIQIAGDDSFLSIAVDSGGLTMTEYTFTGLKPFTEYYWRVRASGLNSVSDWSETREIYTYVPGPVQISPANRSVDVALMPVFSWQEVGSAAGYTIKVAKDVAFTNVVFETDTITVASIQGSGFEYSTTYYWRVRAEESESSTSWSTLWEFTTQNEPVEKPELLSPLNNSAGRSLQPPLRWMSALNASSYRVQIALGPSFVNPVQDVSGLQDTSLTTNKLNIGTQYYWRVAAVGSTGLTVWSDTWNFTTGGLAPTLLDPSNGATFMDLSPTLQWRTLLGAFSYRLQVAKNAVMTNPDFDQEGLSTTSIQITDLSPGELYFWRVNAEDAGGTTGWSDVWTFSTIPHGPVLVSPDSGSTGLEPTLALQWRPDPAATGYKIQVAVSPAFAAPIVDVDQIVTTTFNPPGLSYNRSYVWRVKSNYSGGSSEWSTIWPFSTGLEAPRLFQPVNGASVQEPAVQLIWRPYPAASEYRLQLALDQSFTNIVTDQSAISGTEFAVSGLEDASSYYWRIMASTPSGDTPWSEIWRFDTGIFRPVHIAPLDQSSGITIPVLLQWNAVTNAISYDVQLSENLSFTSNVFEKLDEANLSISIPGLSESVLYYWRIRANFSSGSGLWTNPWSFSTEGSLPVHLSPANGSVNISTAPVLDWTDAPSALSYDLQLALDSTFTQIQLNENSISQSDFALTGLNEQTQYFWRLRAVGAAGPGLWTEPWSFSTAGALPVHLSPPDGALNIATAILLDWTDTPGAQSYDLQLSLDPAFMQLQRNETMIAQSEFLLSGLSEGTEHYWRIRMIGPTGPGSWTEPWSFKTEGPLPVHLSPADGALNLSTQITFDWTDATGALSYDLQLAFDSTFAQLQHDETLIVQSEFSLSGLLEGTRYYWRLRSVSAGGPGSWTKPWSFSTRGSLPVHVAPPDGSNNVSTNIVLDWTDTPAALSYDLQLAFDSTFTQLQHDENSIAQSEFALSGLPEGTQFYWHVRVVGPAGPGPWTDPWTFITQSSMPVHLSPPDAAVNIPTVILIDWTDVTGALSYDLQLSLDPAFTLLQHEESSIVQSEFIVSGLSELTQYYWRLRAIGPLGPGQWTEPWNFTTVEALPLAPELVSPLDNAMIAPPTVTLRWNPVQNAEDYELQVSQLADFSTTVIEQLSIAATFFEVTGLESEQRYYWRIRGRNASGFGSYSDVWSFTTEGIGGALQSQFSSANSGDPIDVSVTIPQGFNPGSATLYFKSIGELAYDSLPMVINGDLASAAIPGNSVNLRGLAAYVRVLNVGGSSSISDPPISPETAPTYINVRFGTVAHPGAPPPRTYAMLTVPAVLDIADADTQFSDDFGPYDNMIWRLFRWDGSQYQEYPDFKSWRNGESYWLISQFGTSIDIANGRSVNPETDAELILQPGWNQIGNPYAFNVAWDSIPGSSALSPPYAFDGFEFIPDQKILEAWKGYFVLNPTASPLALNVAPMESLSIPGKQWLEPYDESYSARFIAKSSSGSWRDSWNTIRIGNSLEERKLLEPPALSSGPQLSFIENGIRYLDISTAAGIDGNAFLLELSGLRSGNPVTVNIAEQGSLPENWSLFVFDLDKEKRISTALRSFSLDAITSGKARRFLVVAGSNEYAAKQAMGISLEVSELALGSSYPNPFTNLTILPYSIAEAGLLKIKVFDIHGRLVSSLVNSHVDPGSYSITWKGLDNVGNPVPPGIYFYRMSTGSQSITRMIVRGK